MAVRPAGCSPPPELLSEPSLASDAAVEDVELPAEDVVDEELPVGPALVVVTVTMVGARLVDEPPPRLTVDVIVAVVDGVIDEAVTVDVVSEEDCVKVEVKVDEVIGVVDDGVTDVTVEVGVDTEVDDTTASELVDSPAAPAMFLSVCLVDDRVFRR